MRWLIAALTIFLVGCGHLYRSIHEGIWPTPEIQREARFDLWRSDDRERIDVGAQVKIKHADVVAWYYQCLSGGTWELIDEDPDKEGIQQKIVNTEVIDGIAQNIRKDIQCMSELGVKVVARNNPGSKIGEKISSMIWVVDIESFIAQHTASQIEQ